MKKKWIYTIVIALVVIVLGSYWLYKGNQTVIKITTEKVGRGTINNTVTATGTLEPTDTVAVGTQVSGRIDKLYADYNSSVHKGELIARLDTQALASQLKSSKATLDQAKAEYEYQHANYERYSKLIQRKLIAQSDFDEVEYNYKSAQSSLNSAEAAYQTNKTNLGYAFIYSPIDGIVIERDVEEGQTVAASYSTPTLFTIAKDLTQMEIAADVDEADIGQVKLNQHVQFYVDAYPDKFFDGIVTEIRLHPTTKESVVTYTVVINAPNPDKILLPGMTANATFYVTEKKNIVVIPNKAVEFSPNAQLLKDYQKDHPELKVTTSADSLKSSESKKIVWVKSDRAIYPVQVGVGDTNEINYELLSGLKEGTEVLTSMTEIKSKHSDSQEKTSSPFMPTRPGHNKNKKK